MPRGAGSDFVQRGPRPCTARPLLLAALSTRDGPAVGAPAESGLFSCRLRCHRNDPSLDDPIPQEYALFLCPTGPLLEKLEEFWRDSKRQCAKNRAHEVFPHITLCDFFTVSRAREPLVLTDTPPEALPCDVQRRWM